MDWYLRGSLLFLGGSVVLFATANSSVGVGVAALYTAGSVFFIIGTLVEGKKKQK